MNNFKKEYIIYAAIVLVVIAIFAMRNPDFVPPTTTDSPTPPASNQQTPPPTPPTTPKLKPTTSPPAQPAVVTFTEQGYSPSTLTVKLGTTVKFVNATNWPMWPASAVHPTHRVYPTSGGCTGSTFDACNEIQPGKSWSFKFDYRGSWKYHDHARPSFTGTIVVQ